MKETKIVEPKSGLDYITAHIYNNTKQRLVLTFEQLMSRKGGEKP